MRLLVVDAAQGVEAQTVANVHMALDHNLEILPVINKIDLPSADPERVRTEIEDVIGLDASNAILASAKEGIGTEEILEGIIHYFPPPKGDRRRRCERLIIDSWFDPYHGAVVMMRVFDGAMQKGTKIRMMSSGRAFEVLAPRRIFARSRWKSRNSKPARSVSSWPASKKSPRPRSATRSRRDDRPAQRAAAGIQTDEADGLQRSLSDRLGPVSRLCATR